MSRSQQFASLPRYGLLLLAVACTGCWEEIEYIGTPSPQPTASTANTETPSSRDTSPSAPQEPEAPAVAPSGETVAAASATPSATASETPADALPTPKPVDDRYATTPVPSANELPATPDVSATEERPSPPPSLTPVSPSPPTAAAASSQPPAAPSTPAAKLADTAPLTPGPTATPATKTPEATTSKPATPLATAGPANNRVFAWQLGSGLSLAALANDRGVAKDKVPAWLAQAQSAAKQLGVTIADLPAAAGPSSTNLASRQVMNYLLIDGQQIGRELTKQHGAETAALFEVAIKSNLLLLLYTPGSTEGASIADAINRAAPRAKLPAELWKPLVDGLDRQLPPSDVRLAVQKLHTDVNQYLSSSAEQGSR